MIVTGNSFPYSIPKHVRYASRASTRASRKLQCRLCETLGWRKLGWRKLGWRKLVCRLCETLFLPCSRTWLLDKSGAGRETCVPSRSLSSVYFGSPGAPAGVVSEGASKKGCSRRKYVPVETESKIKSRSLPRLVL